MKREDCIKDCVGPDCEGCKDFEPVINQLTPELVKELISKLQLCQEVNRLTITARIHYDEARYILEAIKFKQNHKCSLPDSINEALNSGDGIYRP